MGYRRDLWEIAANQHGVVTVAAAEDAGVPAVEVRKLAARGALQRHGQGVYLHRGIPTSRFTQPALAVVLAGDGAFLHRDAVLGLLELGQFNPKQIQVATRRRVRRTLPEWMNLEQRSGIPEHAITTYEGIPATTVQQALNDMESRLPRERWLALLDQAARRELIDPSVLTTPGGAV